MKRYAPNYSLSNYGKDGLFNLDKATCLEKDPLNSNLLNSA